MRSIYLIKVKKGVWNGALGKLRNKGVKGEMKVSIKAHHHGSKINLEYTVNSDSLIEHKTWSSYIDGMLAAQMSSLKNSLNER